MAILKRSAGGHEFVLSVLVGYLQASQYYTNITSPVHVHHLHCIADLSDSDEDDIEYIQVSELDEDDQYTAQVAHGWDFINRGGQLQPYPSVPQICVPMPNFEGRVQVLN